MAGGAALFSWRAFLRCFMVKSPAARASSASPPTAPTPMPIPVPMLLLHGRDWDSVVEPAIAQVEEAEEAEGVVEVDVAIVVGKITCPLLKLKCPSVELQHELLKLGPQQKVWSLQKKICDEL